MTSPTRARIKWFLTLTLLGLIAIIGLQNIPAVTISVLLWTFELPLVVVIVVSYAVGLVVGWLWWPFSVRRSEEQRDD